MLLSPWLGDRAQEIIPNLLLKQLIESLTTSSHVEQRSLESTTREDFSLQPKQQTTNLLQTLLS